MSDDINPWSAEGWNLTAQAVYLKRYGRARAEARARDAGSVFGALKPPGGVKPKTQFGKPVVKLVPPKASGLPPKPPALTQPPKAIGLYTDHLTDRQKRVLYFVRKKKLHDIRLQARMDMGMGADWAVKFTTPAQDLGFTFDFAAVNLYREIDVILNPGDISFAASFNMGINERQPVFGGVTPIFPPPFDLSITSSQPPVELAREIPLVTFKLGEDGMRAAFGNQREITANIDVGLSESYLFNEYNHGVFPFMAGFTEAVNVQLEKDLVATFGIGFAEASAIVRDASLSVAAALGFTETAGQPAATVTANASLGLDEAATTIREASVIVTQDFGFTEAPTVNRDRELTATAGLGFDQVTGQPAATITAAAGVGFDGAATATREALLAASAALGVNEAAAATTTLETVFSAAPSLGFDAAALTSLEKDLAAAVDLGLGVVPFVTFERDSVQDIHQGFDVNVSLQEDFHGGPYTANLGLSEAANLIAEKYLTVPVAMGLTGPVAAIPTVNPLLLEAGRARNPVINATTFAASNTVTYSGVDFGTPTGRRWIVCLIVHGISSRTVTGVTIGGLAASPIDVVPPLADSLGTRRASTWAANVSTGSSGDIVINFSGTETQCTCASYIVDGDVALDANDEFILNANVTGFASQNLAVKSGGMTIAMIHSNNGTASWADGVPAMNADTSGGIPIRSLDGSNYPADITQTTGALTSAAAVSENPMAYGISIHPDPNPPVKLTLNMAMGLTEAPAATTTLETVFSAAPSLGFSEAAAIAREADLAATAAMGLSEAASVSAIAPVTPLTVTFQSQKGSTSTAADNTTDFTAMAAGTASADRWVIAAVHGFGTNRSITTVNCNGVGMTPIVQVGSGSLQPCGLFAALVTSGTTVNIEPIFSGTVGSGCAVAIFTVTGNVTITVQATGSQVSANPDTASIGTANNGVMIAVGGRNGAIAATWGADVTQKYQATTTPSQLRTGGIAQTTGATLNPTLTFSNASTTNMVAASWRSGP